LFVSCGLAGRLNPQSEASVFAWSDDSLFKLLSQAAAACFQASQLNGLFTAICERE